MKTDSEKEIIEITEKTIEILRNEHATYYRIIETRCKNYGESLKDFIKDNVKTFLKYDQGSLSFTRTKLRNVGHDIPELITAAIESAKTSKNKKDMQINQKR